MQLENDLISKNHVDLSWLPHSGTKENDTNGNQSQWNWTKSWYYTEESEVDLCKFIIRVHKSALIIFCMQKNVPLCKFNRHSPLQIYSVKNANWCKMQANSKQTFSIEKFTAVWISWINTIVFLGTGEEYEPNDSCWHH